MHTATLSIDPQSDRPTTNLIATDDAMVTGDVPAIFLITATALKSARTPDRASEYEAQLKLILYSFGILGRQNCIQTTG